MWHRSSRDLLFSNPFRHESWTREVQISPKMERSLETSAVVWSGTELTPARFAWGPRRQLLLEIRRLRVDGVPTEIQPAVNFSWAATTVSLSVSSCAAFPASHAMAYWATEPMTACELVFHYFSHFTSKFIIAAVVFFCVCNTLCSLRSRSCSFARLGRAVQVAGKSLSSNLSNVCSSLVFVNPALPCLGVFLFLLLLLVLLLLLLLLLLPVMPITLFIVNKAWKGLCLTTEHSTRGADWMWH